MTFAHQDRTEDIADNLIYNDVYYNMDDPLPFLEWGVLQYSEYVVYERDGVQYVDHVAMLEDWIALTSV